ncbi:MAG: hypothetical protein H7A00_07855 [Hahellaceae bacterium]|nr:hypothetical protein [Hahellaceae bacterium]
MDSDIRKRSLRSLTLVLGTTLAVVASANIFYKNSSSSGHELPPESQAGHDFIDKTASPESSAIPLDSVSANSVSDLAQNNCINTSDKDFHCLSN